MQSGSRFIRSILVLAFLPVSAFALDTRLEWRVGNDIVLFDETVERTDTGFSAALTTSVGEYDGLVMDSRRSTLEWERRFAAEDTYIRAERNGAEVRVSGTYKGRKYDKTHDIGDMPWYQLHEISYEALYAAGTVSASFWTIDRKTLRPTEFKFTRQEKETIRVMGSPVPAVKYSLTVHGVPAFLFTSYFWLREPDGRFLKLEVPAVFGLPRSSVELTAES